MAKRSEAADLALAQEAAREAGDILLSHWRDPHGRHVSRKRPGDFVSDADLASEAHLKARLLGAAGSDGWMGEETGGTVAANGRRWIVDPLDGTTNFLRGIPHWAISIALEKGGRPCVGVVYDALRDEMFAASSQGAMLNGAPLRGPECRGFDAALFGTGIPFGDMPHIAAHADDIARLMPLCAGVRRFGAASLDLAYVAAGRLDGFWERRLRPWDIAAGLVLLRGAGARVEALDPATTPEETGTVLTAAPGLFAAFAKVLREAP